MVESIFIYKPQNPQNFSQLVRVGEFWARCKKKTNIYYRIFHPTREEVEHNRFRADIYHTQPDGTLFHVRELWFSTLNSLKHTLLRADISQENIDLAVQFLITLRKSK